MPSDRALVPPPTFAPTALSAVPIRDSVGWVLQGVSHRPSCARELRLVSASSCTLFFAFVYTNVYCCCSVLAKFQQKMPPILGRHFLLLAILCNAYLVCCIQGSSDPPGIVLGFGGGGGATGAVAGGVTGGAAGAVGTAGSAGGVTIPPGGGGGTPAVGVVLGGVAAAPPALFLSSGS